jgi:ribosomal protein S6--L-glutamate ligase
MKIGILGWDHGEVDIDLPVMVTTGRALGHQVHLFVLDEIECVAAERGLALLLGGEPAESFDVVISRAQLREDHWRSDVERLCLLSNVPGLPVLDRADVFIPAESKLSMMHQLGAAGLPVPPSCTCRTVEQVQAAFERWGTIVLKGAWGYGGHDVSRVVDFPAERTDVEDRLATYGELLVQPFYPSPGYDIRITVIGDKAALNLRRIPKGDEWRANVGLGGSAEELQPTDEMVNLALRGARAMGVTMAGVDLMPTDQGLVMFEVNNVPGGLYLFGPDRQEQVMRDIYTHAENAAKQSRS